MRTFDVLVRLGWFDPPEQQVYRQLNQNNVDTIEARQLSLVSAQESIVLLKNINKTLPLNMEQLINKKIALIGPMADASVTMQGIYHGRAPFLIDPITGFKNLTAGMKRYKFYEIKSITFSFYIMIRKIYFYRICSWL